MATLTYKDDRKCNREARVIEFKIPNGITTHEFKIICVRLAAALGYHPDNIKEIFGSTEYETEEDKYYRELFKVLK